MKFYLLQEDFSKALTTVSRFVAVRPQLPILANILLVAEKENKIVLSATNMEIGISTQIDAKVEEPGALALPAKEISEFVSYLSPGKLEIETKKKTQLTITSSSGQSSFAGMDPGDFPQIPKGEEEKMSPLPLTGLSEAVGQVSFAAATDDTRPFLAAVNWIFSAKGYRMVATDGYRLSLRDISGIKVKVNKEDEIVNFLVPARSLNEVVRLTNIADEIKVGLTEDGNQVIFSLPNFTLVSRLIEGEFPDYEKIIPADTKTKINLEREEFLQAVKIASIFARESANIVKLSVKEGKVIISANAPSVGENKTEVEAKVTGPELDIAFNYRFLLDFLSAIDSKEKEIEIDLNESLSPGIFRVSGNSAWLHLIMPVRIDL